MCLMVGGLSAASQTYKEYENLQAPITKELAQNLTGRLEQAMRSYLNVPGRWTHLPPGRRLDAIGCFSCLNG